MNQNTVDFRASQFEAVFERGDDCMDFVHGQLIRQGAMAGDLQVVRDAADIDIVDVNDGRQFGRGRAQLLFHAAIALQTGRLFDGRRLTFDVRQHREYFGNIFTDLALDIADETMRLFECQRFRNFNMLLDMQAFIERLDADVMQ